MSNELFNAILTPSQPFLTVLRTGVVHPTWRGLKMSYDISLLEPITKDVIHFDEPHQLKGGTFALGGTTEAWLNVTWNYAKHFYRVVGDRGIRTIYGLTGAEAIPILKKAIEQLSDDVDENDYWNATEGNAKRALQGLLDFAQMRPDGIFEGD